MDIKKLLYLTLKKEIQDLGKKIDIYNSNNEYLTTINAIVRANKVTTENGQYFSYVADQYKIITEHKIEIDSIIVFNNKKYKVKSANDTKEVYNIYYCKYLGLADQYKIQLEETAVQVQENNTYSIKTTCYKNNVVDTNPSIIYSSSDTDIATVNQSGIVTAIKEGSCIISCNYNNVISKITINVIAVPIQNYKVIAQNTGTTDKPYRIRKLANNTFTIVNKDGTDPKETFNIIIDYNNVAESSITILNTTSNSITIKNNIGYAENPLILNFKTPDNNIAASINVYLVVK